MYGTDTRQSLHRWQQRVVVINAIKGISSLSGKAGVLLLTEEQKI